MITSVSFLRMRSMHLSINIGESFISFEAKARIWFKKKIIDLYGQF